MYKLYVFSADITYCIKARCFDKALSTARRIIGKCDEELTNDSVIFTHDDCYLGRLFKEV